MNVTPNIHVYLKQEHAVDGFELISGLCYRFQSMSVLDLTCCHRMGELWCHDEMQSDDIKVTVISKGTELKTDIFKSFPKLSEDILMTGEILLPFEQL